MRQVTRDASGRAQKFTIQEAEEWMEWEGLSLADVVNEDETPGVKLGAVGFARAQRGVTADFKFPYDEVLIVTKGTCSVSTPDQTVTARAGEVIYLAAGAAGAFRADEDVELVYVASSPYGEYNREMKASMRNPTWGE